MRTSHIGEALVQVQQLRQSMLDKQLFRGFSGPVRGISGTIALLAAALMASAYCPATTKAHLLGWGGVFLSALLLNVGATVYWFLHDEAVTRDLRRLRPILDVFPPLAVGALFTLVLILNRNFDYLCGVWMCMFGLTNLASRYVLPPMISVVGVFYILCGALCLLAPSSTFLNPWPMGIVFFTGEGISGLILHYDRRRYAALCRYVKEWTEKSEEEQYES